MKNLNIIYILLLMISLTACEKDNKTAPDNTSDMVMISQTDSKGGDFTVELMAKDTLFAGYNKLYLNIKDKSSGSAVTNATVKLYPLMNMMMAKHAAPVENPGENADANGYFEGAVVFVMPSNSSEYWSMGATIAANGMSDTVSFAIPVVKNPEEARVINVVSPIDSVTYFISLVEPMAPKVGMNDLEFAVHYKKNMMSFPAVDDLTISFVPEMPSMGHSSPNNVDPVFMEDGHYKGQVNFTMTGWWKLNLTLKKGNTLISDNLSFNITFQ